MNMLDMQQQYALDLIDSGQNIFLTGEAGTGKSFVIQHLRNDPNREIIFLGPTGVSAKNIGGVTCHSLFCFPSTVLTPDMLQITSGKQQAMLQLVDTIVIDEISMVRSDLFQAIDIMLKLANNTDESFGGKQLVCVGDYFQLPPVPGDAKVQRYLEEILGGIYAFNTNSWKEADLKPVILNQVHRQHDLEFLNILKSVRTCRHDLGTYLQLCNQRVRPDHLNINNEDFHNPKHICMCCTKKVATAINYKGLAQLPDSGFLNNAIKIGIFPEDDWPTAYSLLIKKGAKVMMLSNSYIGNQYNYVNGDVGVVEDYDPGSRMVLIRLLNNKLVSVIPFCWQYYEYDLESGVDGKLHIVHKEVGQFIQYPLMTSYACTIHKSQGKTLDQAHLVLGRGCFAYGQLYTALSRLRSLNGLTLETPVQFHEAFVDPQVQDFYRQLELEQSFR